MNTWMEWKKEKEWKGKGMEEIAKKSERKGKDWKKKGMDAEQKRKEREKKWKLRKEKKCGN